MNEPKLEIVEVQQPRMFFLDIDSADQFHGEVGDLVIGEGACFQRIPVEWFPALRKHLNEGMEEKWVMQQVGGSMYPYDTEAEAREVAAEFTKTHGEGYRTVRILVPAEPVDGSET